MNITNWNWTGTYIARSTKCMAVPSEITLETEKHVFKNKKRGKFCTQFLNLIDFVVQRSRKLRKINEPQLQEHCCQDNFVNKD